MMPPEKLYRADVYELHAADGAIIRIELSDCQRYWVLSKTNHGRRSSRVFLDRTDAIIHGQKWAARHRSPA